MSLKELAKVANVSVSTVSKAFSGSKEISQKTREAVYTAAREMGVFEKYCKQKPETVVIAVLCPELKSEYYANVVEGLNESANKHNVILMISVCGFDDEEKNRLFMHYAYMQKVDGIIVLGSKESIKNSDKFPLIQFGSGIGTKIDSIDGNMEKAVFSAIEYLRENGHKNIAYIGEKNTKDTNLAFETAMKKLGIVINDEFVYIGNERFEDVGRKGVEYIFKGDTLPTAVFAAYDYIAIGAIESIREKGLKVPDDISIIGTDNIYAAAHMDVPLTSIAKGCGGYDEAIEMILRKIDNRYAPIKAKNDYKMNLIKRESVKNIKKPTDII